MRRNVRRTVLAVFAFLVLVGSGYAANNLVFGGRARGFAGTPHRFRIQLGVDDRQVQLVTEGVRLAEAAFADLVGTRVPRPVTVRLARRTPCVPFSRGHETAVADGDGLCVNTASPGWTFASRREPDTALSVVAHELFHTLQGQFGCLPGPGEHRYAWWVEGTATYLGWRAVEHAGRVTEADITAKMRAWGGWRPDLGPLEGYERSISGDPAYALAARAVVQLVRRSGEASLIDFCRQVGQGQAWQEAFRTSFGLSVPDFYGAFERSRGP